MTNIEKITILANQLANEGKKPSVALIKARLKSPVPLPQIISSLKFWEHDPEHVVLIERQETTHETNKVDDKTNEVSQSLLNEALAPIHKELAEIKDLLKMLIKEQ